MLSAGPQEIGPRVAPGTASLDDTLDPPGPLAPGSQATQGSKLGELAFTAGKSRSGGLEHFAPGSRNPNSPELSLLERLPGRGEGAG